MNLRAFVRAAACALSGCILSVGCRQTDWIARELPCSLSGTCSGKGTCEPTSCRKPTAALHCTNDGPSIRAGDGCSDVDPSASVSRFALCSCTDFVSQSALIVDDDAAPLMSHDTSGDDAGMASVVGRIEPVPHAASVAVNKSFYSTADVDVDGALQYTTTDSGGLVGDAMISGGTFRGVPGSCNCQSRALFDIPAWVEAHAQDNDNASQSLAVRAFDGVQGPGTLSLPCGRYYLQRVAGESFTLHVRGRVELFIGSTIEIDKDFRVILDEPQGAFELFVAGTVRVSRAFTVGSSADAPRARVYIGGDGTFDIGTTTLVAGSFYAPHIELVTHGKFEAFGSVFLRRVAPEAEMRVHYDARNAAPSECND